MWQCHVVDGLANNRFAFYFKIHHTLLDGVGIASRFGETLTRTSEVTAPRPIWTVGSAAAPHANAAATHGFVTSVGIAKLALRMGNDIRRTPAPDMAVPFRIRRSMFNERIGAGRQIATRSVPVARVRAVADAAGVTINEVLLAVSGGALRRYLAGRGRPTDQPLIAGVPVSLRDAADTQQGNAFTMTVMNLGNEIADPVARVRRVSRSSRLAKRRLRELPPGMVPWYGEMFTVPFVVQHLAGLGGRLWSPYHIVVSNVVGPAGPRYLAGARLEALHPVGSICHGMALFIGGVSAGDQFCLGFTSDDRAVPRLAGMADHANTEFAELEQRLGAVADGHRI
jgi:WS/DGAT/MGAT family acyltransferase